MQNAGMNCSAKIDQPKKSEQSLTKPQKINPVKIALEPATALLICQALRYLAQPMKFYEKDAHEISPSH